MTQIEAIKDPNIISFPKLGWEFSIDPTAFTVFGIEINWYGIIITLGLILAFVYCFPKMKRFGLDSDRTIDVVIGGVLGGIVGARVYYVLARWDEYAWDWKAIVNTRNGGLAIYGGLIGAIAVGMLICKIRKVKILPMLDISVLGFLIGQGIGRWGNFVNQEAFGTNTDSFLGMTGGTIQKTIINSTAYMDGDMFQNGISIDALTPVHPCFLYESLWCILGFVILSFWSKRRKYDGQIFLMYLMWYGAERFFVEGLRTDSLMAGNIRISQALSALLFIVSIILQIVIFSKRRRDPESFVLYCSTEASRLLIEETRRKKMGIPLEDIKIDDMTDDDFDDSIIDDDFDDDDFDGDDFDDDLDDDDDEQDPDDEESDDTDDNEDDDSEQVADDEDDDTDDEEDDEPEQDSDDSDDEADDDSSEQESDDEESDDTDDDDDGTEDKDSENDKEEN